MTRQLEILIVGLAALLNVGMLIVGVTIVLTGSYVSDGTSPGESLLAPNLFLLLYAGANLYATYILVRRCP